MHRNAGRRRAPLLQTRCALLPFDDQAGVCARCGAELTGQQRRWCSGACMRHYQDNHVWGFARPACLARSRNRCRRCGKQGTPVDPTEVNHKIPRNGRGMGAGCMHHQDNLEALCHKHHVEVTNHQRVARARTKVRMREAVSRAEGD